MRVEDHISKSPSVLFGAAFQDGKVPVDIMTNQGTDTSLMPAVILVHIKQPVLTWCVKILDHPYQYEGNAGELCAVFTKGVSGSAF